MKIVASYLCMYVYVVVYKDLESTCKYLSIVTSLTNVAIAKSLIGSSSSVTNSVNASRIPALYSSLIATATEYIFLDSGFQKVCTYNK